ncbi:MAG: peptidoglycan D,D-transpeptidase FtsI family protein [Candidatus Hodarchaeales archaeon]
MFLIVIVIWSGVITRLVFLQILRGGMYKALAKGQQEIINTVTGERGTIYIYDNDKLSVAATNKTQPFCYLSLKVVEDIEATATQLSQILNLEAQEILEKINNSESHFVIVKKELTKEEIEGLKKLNLKGVYLETEQVRYYPQKYLASDILGFVNSDGRGNYGIEGFFNNVLSGKEKLIKQANTFFGKIFDFNPNELKGEDIVLTIDKNIQAYAQFLLEEASEDLGINSGQIIVVNPKNGKVLALVDYPPFDPNKYQEYAKNPSIFLNKAIQTLYEPGSTFKPITMAAAINEGKVTPDTTYEDKGFVKIGGRTIYNYGQRVWGIRSMKEVLEKSINTGAVFVEQQLGHQLFLKYLEKFGVFEKTNIQLEGEIYSLNKELKKGYEVNFATAAFGQGIELTPINLVRIYTALANKGNLMRLTIVDKIIDNKKTQIIEPKIERKNIITEKTAEVVTKMLVGVVEEGFGKRAKVPGYYIAGKTGTSQIPYSSLGINKKGYSDATWQSFIGYFPAFDPQVLILVKLDNPKTRTAEYSACPVFKKLAQYIINYYKIPPDYSIEK